MHIWWLIFSYFLKIIARRSANQFARFFAHEIVRWVAYVIVTHFAKMRAEYIAMVVHFNNNLAVPKVNTQVYMLYKRAMTL